MKKVILLMAVIGLVTMAATTKSSVQKSKEKQDRVLLNEKYKACIEACNNCAISCEKCVNMCSKDGKMSRCVELCKETAASCKATSKLLSLDGENAKESCHQTAKIADLCAAECEKFTADHCQKSAADCRKAAKLCKEI